MDIETRAPERLRIRDLRDWIEVVDRAGELRVVEGADWNQEIGGITELNNRQKGPALLFDGIKGYPPGQRIITGTMQSPARLAATLRLGTDFDNQRLVQALRGKPQAWEQAAKDYPPLYVDHGPIFENVLRGDEVDLTRFPVPLWHEKDGGRYIGTGDFVISRDPENGWVNCGTYRMMIHDARSTSIHIILGKHGRQQMERTFKSGQPFPMAVSLGHDPLLYLVSGVEIPYGLSEYNYIGAILGEPVRVVRGEVTGLPIPADAEIVLEGWCRPGVVKNEGPFGEFAGYYSYTEAPVPVFEVERVYHRNNPIQVGSPPGRPPHDYSYSKAVMRSAMLHDAIEKAGVPGVQGCWCDEVGGSRMLLVVAIQQRYPGHARQAALVASQCHVGAYFGRYVIVVDDDIDPSNLNDVMWAVCTRSDPERDIDIIRRAWGSKADPLHLTTNQRLPFNSRAIIDACRPYDYLEEFPPVAEGDPEYLAQLQVKWGDVLGSTA